MPTVQHPATEKARRILEGHEGDLAVVYFRKRTTGYREERRMTCTAHPDLEARADMDYDPTDRSLMLVWDAEKGEPRAISLNGVREIRVGGETHAVNAPQSRAPDDNDDEVADWDSDEMQALRDQF